MAYQIVAVPAEDNLGLESPVSGHFGHCPSFIISTIEDGKIIKVDAVTNGTHTSCADPVNLLARNGVNVLITRGLGMRPYMITQQLGISVVRAEGTTVRETLDNYIKGFAKEMNQDGLCRGGGHNSDI